MKRRHLDRVGGERGTARFTIPAPLARLEPEMTDEGILLRFRGLVPREPADTPASVDAPDWTKQ